MRAIGRHQGQLQHDEVTILGEWVMLQHAQAAAGLAGRQGLSVQARSAATVSAACCSH